MHGVTAADVIKHYMKGRKLPHSPKLCLPSQIEKEKTFVLVPAGPRFLLSFGKALERVLPEWLLAIIALRQTFICRKKRE